MSKRSTRSRLLAERKSCPPERCLAASREIQRRFLASGLLDAAGCVALYSAIHNEVGTDDVADRAIAAGKLLAYPRVRGEQLEFVRVASRADLEPGAFGVREPVGGEITDLAELDLVVVPGVAFDGYGHRLGYGRGFYDRALAACRSDCARVGFAYEFQLVDALPAAGHDQALTQLVTERRIINFAA